MTMELDLRDACPILIEEDDLYQIVFNLMENGIKYNVRGGVLRVCLQREADNAVLTVEDTGQESRQTPSHISLTAFTG